jgi:nucleoside 2-deoxyribosyltransferase
MSSPAPRIYLAGPEVFLRDAAEIYARKRDICRRHGFAGVSPLDTNIDLAGLALPKAGWQISRANEESMRRCDLLVANLTPFRSPSADPGTAYELGFFRALGKPVLGYTNAPGTLLQRTRGMVATSPRARHDSPSEHGQEDAQGYLIENFGLVDNLMLDGAILSSGFEIVQVEVAAGDLATDLRGFEQCVQLAAALRERMNGRSANSGQEPFALRELEP